MNDLASDLLRALGGGDDPTEPDPHLWVLVLWSQDDPDRLLALIDRAVDESTDGGALTEDEEAELDDFADEVHRYGRYVRTAPGREFLDKIPCSLDYRAWVKAGRPRFAYLPAAGRLPL